MADDHGPGMGMRRLRGPTRWLEHALFAAMVFSGIAWVADLPVYLRLTFYKEQFVGLFWALLLCAVFVVVPAHKSAPRDRVPWYDWILFVLSAASGLYVTFDYARLLNNMAYGGWDMWLPGAVTVLLLIEATRRATARALLIVLLCFLLYAAFAEHFPGVLNGNATSFERLAIYLYLDNNGLLGIPLLIIAGIALAYILLGNVLNQTGGAKVFTDLAIASMGKYRGGPAKISVGASTFFGAISGAAVSNVMTTGVITIPMMKRYGYRPETAGAVEAVASTGGQILPPVMGAVAFLMAELLDKAYAEVALAALVPGLLYYLLVFIQVDLEAARRGIKGLPAADRPKALAVLRTGWVFLIPVAALIYVLFWMGLNAGKAGLITAGLAILVAYLVKATRPSLRTLWDIVVGTGRGLLELGVIGAIVAIVIGALNISGLGVNLASILTDLGGDSILLMLLLSAGLCILMGMGMPTIAVYLLLAVLVAPSLVKLGLEPLAVHLFILYFGMMSMLSPPVAIASFVAASIAQANGIKTAWESVRLGAMAFVVPFIFIYSPELILVGRPVDIVWSILSTTVGCVIMGVALAGYLFRPVAWPWRLVLAVAAVLCFLPHRTGDGLGHYLNLLGAAAAVVWFASARMARPVEQPTPQAGE